MIRLSKRACRDADWRRRIKVAFIDEVGVPAGKEVGAGRRWAEQFAHIAANPQRRFFPFLFVGVIRLVIREAAQRLAANLWS